MSGIFVCVPLRLRFSAEAAVWRAASAFANGRGVEPGTVLMADPGTAWVRCQAFAVCKAGLRFAGRFQAGLRGGREAASARFP